MVLVLLLLLVLVLLLLPRRAKGISSAPPAATNGLGRQPGLTKALRDGAALEEGDAAAAAGALAAAKARS